MFFLLTFLMMVVIACILMVIYKIIHPITYKTMLKNMEYIPNVDENGRQYDRSTIIKIHQTNLGTAQIQSTILAYPEKYSYYEVENVRENLKRQEVNQKGLSAFMITILFNWAAVYFDSVVDIVAPFSFSVIMIIFLIWFGIQVAEEAKAQAIAFKGGVYKKRW